jgi:hypothetical protein
MSSTPSAPNKISANDVELVLNSFSPTDYVGSKSRMTFNDTLVRQLAKVLSGAISMDDLRGKTPAIPAGTIVNQACNGPSLTVTYADGNNGTYDVATMNSSTCVNVVDMTTSQTWTVPAKTPAGLTPTKAAYLVVAGGGGGSGCSFSQILEGGGGGGAGGCRWSAWDKPIVPGQKIVVSIGGGGTGGLVGNTPANGTASTVTLKDSNNNTQWTATVDGGGYGAWIGGGVREYHNATRGGSGGGGSPYFGGQIAATTLDSTEGNDGGQGTENVTGGGGGGWASAGGTGGAGNGGAGKTVGWGNATYSVGGGGASCGNGGYGTATHGGGFLRDNGNDLSSSSGEFNTGGGGAGTRISYETYGGSGRVVIWYS